MTKTLEMVFKTAGGKEVTLNLAEPKAELTKAAVMAVMQDMISRNIFITASGELSEALEARIRTLETTALV